MAAPRGPFGEMAHGLGRPARLQQRLGQRDDVESAVRDGPGRGGEPLQEQVAELLVVAVQLAVGGDQDEAGLAVGEGGAGQPGGDALPGEPVGVGRGRGLERDGARQPAVVEGDDDRAPPAELEPVRPPRVETGVGRLPRREDRVADTLLGENPERRQVHRGLRQPEALGRRPKRSWNSRSAQRISVRRSAADASGRIAWW